MLILIRVVGDWTEFEVFGEFFISFYEIQKSIPILISKFLEFENQFEIRNSSSFVYSKISNFIL